jgi:hypothetical protein
MIEQTVAILACVVVFLAAVMRLNVLKASRHSMTWWRVLEVLGLAGLMGGCAGSIGEWFLPNAEFHAETIILVSVALVAIGISQGQLCQVVARLQGWDGTDRRTQAR